MKSQKKLLGEIMVENGTITRSQLQKALEIQNNTKELLGKILINLGYITEKDLVQTLAAQIGIPFLDLSKVKLNPAIAKFIPPYLAQRHLLLPLTKTKDKIVLAMANPLNVFAIDEVKLITGLEVEPIFVMEDQVVQAIHNFYGVEESTQKALESLQQLGIDLSKIEVSKDSGEDISVTTLKQIVEDEPVVRLVNAIIVQAIEMRSSDIHVEPLKEKVRIRYRIDGVLREIMTPPKKIQPALISRIKVLAGLDIAETRIPQDGRINLVVQAKEFDFRVSTYPTPFGEKIVMRILDKSSVLIGLNKLGFHSETQTTFEKLVHTPVGMILVTGPTGSGKSTTLYSVLNKLNSVEKHILTIEDPVEYQLVGINQVQVNPKAGLEFSNALRAFLRNDPDIIMVGEIRDKETAEIAIQASLTGHLVLSTLHTNDAPSATTRLIDMGIEPFMVSSSIIGVLAQRLARILCPECKEPYKPPDELLRKLGIPIEEGKYLTFYRPRGCSYCDNIGYKGRTGIFELMTIDDHIKDLIVKKESSLKIKQAALNIGMQTLQQDALRKIIEGVTSVEEAMRVVYVG